MDHADASDLRSLGLVDSHCHLQQLEPGDRDRALDEARERGVEGFLVPAIDLEDAPTLFELAERHADVWLAIGVHPHEAKHWQAGDAERLRSLLDHPKVVAVGECGLDYHYDNSPRDQQGRAMREQWEVAVEAGLPVIVHNRESDDDALAMLGEPAFAELRGVFHSFSAGATMARQVLSHGGSHGGAHGGFWLGLSGMVTFRAADNVREVLAFAPVERLLVETDTPFLAPVPYRGKPNRPAYVVEVADRVALDLGIERAELDRRTGAGFLELFARAAGRGANPAPG
jgi:TatD DNase family protein